MAPKEIQKPPLCCFQTLTLHYHQFQQTKLATNHLELQLLRLIDGHVQVNLVNLDLEEATNHARRGEIQLPRD